MDGFITLATQILISLPHFFPIAICKRSLFRNRLGRKLLVVGVGAFLLFQFSFP